MATRKTVVGAKRTYEITSSQLEKFAEGAFSTMECCAFIEFSGVEGIRSVEDAVALRRAASGDVDGHVNEDGFDLEILYTSEGGYRDRGEVDHRGAVLVTTVPTQSRAYPFLLGAGFQKLGTFKGNSLNQVTLWGAQVLRQTAKPTPKDPVESVTVPA